MYDDLLNQTVLKIKYTNGSESELENEEVDFDPGAWLIKSLHYWLKGSTGDKLS